jgi:hypothetical protein
MMTQQLRRWLGGVAISVIALTGYAQPLPATPTLPELTPCSTQDHGGHASKEAIRASQYALLRKQLQTVHPKELTTTEPWWNTR